MDNNRLKHSIGVARKMIEIAQKLNLSNNEIDNCFLIGYNHDIGYEFTKNGYNHNKIGGLLLKKTNFTFWKEVYYHGEPNCNFKSIYLNILNQADMQVDKFGNDVGYEKRLQDIKNRYKKTSEIYNKCNMLVMELRGQTKEGTK